MKTLIAFALATGLAISPLAISSPNGGLADRINEARTYPDKLVEQDSDKQNSEGSGNIHKSDDKRHTCH